jgi:hypothetical protein
LGNSSVCAALTLVAPRNPMLNKIDTTARKLANSPWNLGALRFGGAGQKHGCTVACHRPHDWQLLLRVTQYSLGDLCIATIHAAAS